MTGHANLRLRNLCALLLLLSIALLTISSSNNPPNGRTGAPGDGLCSDCHSQSSPPQDGSVSISGLPASIMPSTEYTLTVTVANPNGLGEEAGFQMVVLNSSNQNAGSMSNPSSSSTVTNSGGRMYHEHNPSVQYGANTEITWTVDWTSPIGPDMEMITAYAAGNVANGNNSSSGDLIVTSTSSGNMMGSLLTVEMSSTDVSCSGGADGTATATPSGGMPDYSYAWSNGGSTATITGLAAGSYSVTVTDDQGSTAVASVDVNEPTLMGINVISQQPPLCNGSDDGSINVEVEGGTPGYTYLWSTGANTAMISGLTSGSYSLTVSDFNGCTVSTSVVLNDPTSIDISLISLDDPFCAGESSGAIEVEGSGGGGSYTYLWSTGDTGPMLQNVPQGSYTVTVSDINGCSAETSYTLTDPEPLDITLESQTDVTCAGGADGELSVSASGSAPFSFDWSNGLSGPDISSLSADTYSVTVTDANGCTAVGMYTISEPAGMTISLTVTTPILCFGDSNGEIAAVVAGGSPPYSFMWSDGQNGEAAQGLAAGVYSLTVTDANGCTASAQFELTQPAQLSANASATDETGAGTNDGSATADPMGGVEPYTYSWTNGATSQTITDLIPADYTVTVTDANGCTAIQTVTVNAFGCTLQIQVTTSDVSCFGEDDGTAQVTWSGANGPVSIVWSNGDTTDATDGLSAGSVSVTVSDSTGCVAQANAMIDQPEAPLAMSCSVVHESAVGAEDGMITCKVSGGTQPYSMPGTAVGADSFVVASLAPGSYDLTVVDANGCMLVESVTVNEFGCDLEISVPDVDICFGEDFLVTISPDSIVSAEWSNGQTGLEVTLEPGDYCVTVTDAQGCTASDCFVINELAEITITVDSVTDATEGENNGAINITIDGGQPAISYEWYLGGELVSTAEDPTGLAPGNYIVEVTDATGCFATLEGIEVGVTSSVADINARVGLEVYPNPAQEHITISWDVQCHVASIKMLDMNGREVVQSREVFQGGTLRMATTDLQHGIYYLVVESECGTAVKKVVRI